MRTRTILIAVGIVAVLIVGYWVVIGFGSQVDDFSPPDIPSDFSGDTGTHTYVAYSTFAISYDIKPYTGLYSGTQLTQGLTFASVSIATDVKPFVSMDEGRIYHQNQLRFDSGGENSGGTGTSKVTVQYYAIVEITGENNYVIKWQGPNQNYINPQTSTQSSSFTTGRAFFYENGPYTATVMFYQYISGTPTLVFLSSQFFEVNV